MVNPNNIMDPFSNIYINIQQNHQDFDQQWIDTIQESARGGRVMDE